jgi:predicted nucleic acid-binding protein
VTTEIALRWGQAQAVAALRGRPVPVLDGLIGATALVHGLTVVTRNTADMAEFGVPVFNPWNIA